MLVNCPTFALFPSFKKLSVEDIDTIRSVSQWRPPYSDTNFVRLWSWDTEKQTRFSILDTTLIVQTFYNKKPQLIVLGDNTLGKSFQQLYSYAKNKGITQIEYLAEPFRQFQYEIHEDRDRFDYLYSLTDIATLEGLEYHAKRNLSKRFAQERRPHIQILDLKNPDVREEVSLLFHAWVNQKEFTSQDDYISEFMAIENCFDLAVHMNSLVGIGLYSFNSLVGVCIAELLPYNYTLIHFEKTDLSSQGISEYLLQHAAQKLLEFGSQWMNYEQDLGIEGLRHAKLLWKPKTFLKKYTVRVE